MTPRACSSAPMALLGLSFPEEQMPSLNSGFLPGQGGQGSGWPPSCCREEVSVLAGAGHALRESHSNSHHGLCPRLGGAGTAASGSRWPAASPVPLPLGQGGRWAGRCPRLISRALWPQWGSQSACAGWARVLASPGWSVCRSHPPVCTDERTGSVTGRDRLPGQRTGEWQARGTAQIF